MNFFLSLALIFIFFIPRVSLAATLVTSEQADTLLTYPKRSSPARVIALNHSIIPAQTSGVITKLLVNVGDEVLKGEVLAKLDCKMNVLNHRAQSAQYDQIYSQLLFNKRELVRGESLLKKKNIGEAELDRINNALKNSRALLKGQKASVESALLNVERCNIKAPFNGVVTKRLANLGEMIDVGNPLIELVEDKNLEVSAKIASSDEQSFYQAKAYTLDISGKLYNVTLRAYLPLIENNERSREARFLFIDEQALAGNTGRLSWQSSTPYLSAHLLQKRNGRNGYFIIENNKAKFIEVPTAQKDDLFFLN